MCVHCDTELLSSHPAAVGEFPWSQVAAVAQPPEYILIAVCFYATSGLCEAQNCKKIQIKIVVIFQ